MSGREPGGPWLIIGGKDGIKCLLLLYWYLLTNYNSNYEYLMTEYAANTAQTGPMLPLRGF